MARLSRMAATHPALRSVGVAVSGGLVVALVTLVGYRLQATDGMAALSYLFVIVVHSLRATLSASLVVSVIAGVCLDFFFTPPLFEMRLTEAMDVIALLAFSTAALVIKQLMNRLHKSLQSLSPGLTHKSRSSF